MFSFLWCVPPEDSSTVCYLLRPLNGIPLATFSEANDKPLDIQSAIVFKDPSVAAGCIVVAGCFQIC
jgi:hypothetical protein